MPVQWYLKEYRPFNIQMIRTTPIRSITHILLGVVLFTSACASLKNQKMSHPETTEITYAVNSLSMVPLRAEPNHQSEMVTQVLFGEYMIVLQNKAGWSYVQLEQDSYKGWAETIQLTPVSEADYKLFKASPKTKVADAVFPIRINNKNTILFKGCNLPFYSDGIFLFDNEEIPFKGAVIRGIQNSTKIVNTALSYLNTPYLWGGKTPLGVDCSGFTQMVYHLNGYTIHRDASLQAKQGELVAFLQQAQAGDLAFFDNEEENITHVGIVLDNEKIIHAAQGKVRIDRLDQEGIYNEELKRYTHHLRLLRHYFSGQNNN